ncbi:hypothetical protein L917_06685 [Phytophthora nicotianae]|uniref:Uncharacterized protein n=1 Tax=Phytophthora nicotianae TaxID=4792 RepID=W2LDL3_PHYNI|nr:hypothetical protein L917_06685 [Phytophthora nicotianae]
MTTCLWKSTGKTDFGWRKLLLASACWLRLVRSDKREKVFTLVHQLDSARTAVGYGGTQRVNAQGKNLQDASAATSSRYSCSSHAASARQKLDKLLGPLRHIGLCCRATRAFVQRLHYVWRSAPQYGMLRLTSDVVHDLMWIEYLLVQGVMNQVPTSIIAGTLPPDVNLFMDASNWGLAVLYLPFANIFGSSSMLTSSSPSNTPLIPRSQASALMSGKCSARC